MQFRIKQIVRTAGLFSLLLFFSITIHTSCEKYEPPVASFNCDKTSGDAPLAIEFTSSSQGDITSYAWNFGDGGSTSTQNAHHTYTEAGTYTAMHTVTGPGGSNSSTKTITVSEPPPEASFTCSPTSGVVPLTVNFTSTSSGAIDSYSWNFGDGGTSSSQYPSHTFHSQGTYTVRLTVTGPGGSDSSTKSITVSPPVPVASFTCSSTSGNAPHTVYFTSTSSGTISSYSWTFGDGGTSSSQHPMHTYNSQGTYTAKLTVTGPGGSDSYTRTITVAGSPGTNIIFNNKTHTEIKVTINFDTRTIPVDGSVTYSSIQGSSVTYSAYTHGVTDIGSVQIGLKLNWGKTLTLTGETQSRNLIVGSDKFFIYMKNASTHTLKNLYVNYGLSSQTVDYIRITKSDTYDPLGYYKAWTNSNVRIYWEDDMSWYYYWDQGDHFTMPWEDNQSVNLRAIDSKSGNAVTGEISIQAVPGTSELPKGPYILRTDPDAIDDYCD